MSSKHRQHLSGYLQSHKVKGGGHGKKEQKTSSAGFANLLFFMIV